MDEKRTTSPFITLILVLTMLCVVATSVFTFGLTRTPQDYAEATMIAAATATALPFKATEMAEGLRHQQTVNASQEQAYKTLMQGLVVFAKVLLGAGGILAVMWVIAGSFKAGSVSVQAAKQAALPGFVDLGDGYRLLNDGEQVRLLDVRTGRSHPLVENGEVLPVRAEIAKAEILARALVEIAEKTNSPKPADWLGPVLQGFDGVASNSTQPKDILEQQ